MKRQDYFPGRIGDQIVWLNNFNTKLPIHAPALGLSTTAIAGPLLDVANAIYGLDNYRGALSRAVDSCYQSLDEALYAEEAPGQVAWRGFTPPAGAPNPVPNGCLKRLFAFISDVVKKAAGYTEAIGADLGTEGAAEAPPDPATTTPAFSLRAAAGGKVEVVWKKGVFDGVKLEFDLGAAGLRTEVDLRPNYTLNWLPASGTSAIIKVRLRYLYKGEDFGNWSGWETWTLTGQ